MYRLENIKIREDLSEDKILEKACNKYKINIEDIKNYEIAKFSIDARNKNDIHYIYTIDIELKNDRNLLKNVKFVSKKNTSLKVCIKRKSFFRPVVIGSGPAGLFCALTLAYNGLKPILIEQGKCVEERQKDIEDFLLNQKLNINSNVQFGEGGAGTFSDGKLNSGISSIYCRNVLEEFVKFGAPKQILYTNKPHIGTDNLIKIVPNIRNEIIRLGGSVLFQTKFIDFETTNNKLTSIICETKKDFKIDNNDIEYLENQLIKIKTDCAVLAIGHSARDTFEMLYSKNIKMERKNFSLGVRIEHKQDMINKSQYGEKTNLKLPPADYKLAYHGKERSCYTFCMCPGGVVIASSSGYEEIVTNGMSKFARNEENANSAVLVNIVPEDFEGENPLERDVFSKRFRKKGIYFRRFELFCTNSKISRFFK